MALKGDFISTGNVIDVMRISILYEVIIKFIMK